MSELPSSIEEFIAARLGELQTLVKNLSAVDVGMRWRGRISEHAAEPERVREVQLERSDVLRVASPATLLNNPQADAVALFAGRAAIEMPAANRAFLQRLVERKHFVAQDALGFCEPDEELAWDNVREALELLVVSGALSIDTASE